MPNLGWCDSCNVPILDASECGICGSTSQIIRSHEVKPIFKIEREKINDLLGQQSLGKNLIPEKLSFRDIQGYVLSDGIKLLRLAFSAESKRWYVKPTKSFNVNRKLRGSELETVIRANEHILKAKESEAFMFLKKVIEDHSDIPLAVAFSGGKDSAVALALTRKLQTKFDVVFLDTTIELPETVEYTEELAKLWNLNLISVKPSHDFLELCKLIGPPSRFMKWCCKTQKFSQMNKLLHERYNEGVIMVRGVRAAESGKRGSYKRVGKMKWTPNEVIANPILKWTSLDVWLYMFWKKIPYNKAYEYGFSRIGCWACPAKSLKDFSLLEGSHPELINKLYTILDCFAVKQNIGKKWISSGDWRYRKSQVNRMSVCASKPCSTSREFVFSIDNSLVIKNILEFFKVFGTVKKKGIISGINGKDVEISTVGKSIRILFKNEDKEDRILRYLQRALNCIGCGACQAVCDKGAIKQIDGRRIIDETICTGCQKCLTFTCISLRYGSDRLSVTL
jgi:phosphoadenosine phosphosulfate reductase